MPRKTLKQIQEEFVKARDIAKGGYIATPQDGLRGRVLGAKFEPLHPSGTSPGDTPPSNPIGTGDDGIPAAPYPNVPRPPQPMPNRNLAMDNINQRLTRLEQLYQSGAIDYQDYEAQKQRVLSEL